MRRAEQPVVEVLSELGVRLRREAPGDAEHLAEAEVVLPERLALLGAQRADEGVEEHLGGVCEHAHGEQRELRIIGRVRRTLREVRPTVTLDAPADLTVHRLDATELGVGRRARAEDDVLEDQPGARQALPGATMRVAALVGALGEERVERADERGPRAVQEADDALALHGAQHRAPREVPVVALGPHAA